MTADREPDWVANLRAAVPAIRRRDLTRLSPPRDSRPKPAAVLVLFGAVSGLDPHLLLVERAASLRAHAAQVAFPGGAQDAGDEGPVAAALREASEETGLDPRGVEVLGTLPALWLPVSDYLVTPVVSWWGELPAVSAVDPTETAAVHLLAVTDLLDRQNRGSVRHPSGYVGPAFRVGSVLVWGFTAGVLAGLLRAAGWERPWDHERFFDPPDALPAGVGAGSIPPQTAEEPP